MKKSLIIFVASVVGCSAGDSSDSGTVDAAAGLVDANSTADAESRDDLVPSEAEALNAFLVAKRYEGFAAEPAIHPTAGPHKDTVRSFFNSVLDSSLRAGGDDHPVGSAVIKELYKDDVLDGWAVMVKTANSAATPADDWYFYEVLSAAPGTGPVAQENGASLCAGCHGAGTDYIRTSYP